MKLKLIKFCMVFFIVAMTIFSCKGDKVQEAALRGAVILLKEKHEKMLSCQLNHCREAFVNSVGEAMKDSDNTAVFGNNGSGILLWKME